MSHQKSTTTVTRLGLLCSVEVSEPSLLDLLPESTSREERVHQKVRPINLKMYLPVLRFPGPPLQRSEEFPFRVLVETQWKQHETTSQCLVRSKIPSSLAGVEKRPPDSFLKVGKT